MNDHSSSVERKMRIGFSGSYTFQPVNVFIVKEDPGVFIIHRVNDPPRFPRFLILIQLMKPVVSIVSYNSLKLQ